MGAISLWICIACYLFTATEFAYKRDYPMALVFAAYAIANYGFIMVLERTAQ